MSFIAQFTRIQAEIQRRGISAYDMRDEGHLELVFIGPSGNEFDADGARQRVELKWLDSDPTLPRPIPALGSASPIRYFLDGSQRTLRALYCQNVPIVTGIVAAAILERNDRGDPRVLPGMLAFRHVWVIPRRSNIAELDQLIEIIESKGGEVVDPMEQFTDDRYADELLEFGGLIELGYKRVGKIREEIETELVRAWCSARPDAESLLLVDGPLRETCPGAIGLVKSFTRQYVSGNEATALFRLRDGERSAAFQVADGWRSEHPVNVWYQRHFDATGRDPRHALIRVELSTNWQDQPPIDDVAGWIMRERTPAAKADARWATLLYPVHYLEQVLKRHIEAQTRGWTTRS